MFYVALILFIIFIIFICSLGARDTENTNKLQKDNEYEEEKEIVLNAFALVGFILGLLSTVLYWVLAIVPILAIIFSIIGIVGAEKAKQKGKGIAIAGLILGILYTGQFGLKIFLKNNNYFQDSNFVNTVNIEDEKVDEELNYCGGGNIIICNEGYTCTGGQIMSCMGGMSMSCTGGNMVLGTSCIHGMTYAHTYKTPCQHGQTISHTYTNPCMHGFTYAHNQPCAHGFTYTHNYTEKCVHGYEKSHNY